MDVHVGKKAGGSERGGVHLTRRTMLGYAGAAGAAALAGHGLAGAGMAQESGATPAAVALDWPAIDQQLAAVAPDTALLAAELAGGEVIPIHAYNAEAVFPVGSSFKLWILGAVAIQVEAGTLDWEQMVTIEDRYRSVPGGDLRYVEAGTTFSMRYLAERMIQKSDNTATDHVLALAGRENVEAAMATMGHHDPSLNIPLISTRDLAMMKFAYPTDQLDAYYAASVDERRRILAEVIDEIPYEALANTEDQVAPLEIDRVEWFATREDLARTMSWLHEASQRPGLRQVAEILSLETPLPFEGETWPYVGYKGGSELGVLSATWLLQRADGRVFCYSVGFRDPEAGIDMEAAIAVLEAGRDVLARA